MQKLDELKDYLLTLNGNIDIKLFACDLTDDGQRGNLFDYIGNLQFARVINVAGADIQKEFLKYTQQKLVFQMRICAEAAMSICLFAIQHRAERLNIINISSVSGIYPMPYFAVYSAAKGALTSFSLALNEELKASGVHVCAVLPGAIYTRQDVIEYISTQGIWGKIAAKQPDYVVKVALKAADKGKSKVVVGFANKLMAVFTRLIPLKLKLKFIAAKWSKTQKDAF
jgi:hypothetical protein